MQDSLHTFGGHDETCFVAVDKRVPDTTQDLSDQIGRAAKFQANITEFENRLSGVQGKGVAQVSIGQTA